jgi:hypothetical protein
MDSFGEGGRRVARSISVYPEGGGEPLYEEPLGSESAVRESWSEPAAALGLPLLAAVYDHGFYHGTRWAGAELRQVLDELARLEGHWSSAGLPPDILKDLRERAGNLRAAVALAQERGGFVDIG